MPCARADTCLLCAAGVSGDRSAFFFYPFSQIIFQFPIFSQGGTYYDTCYQRTGSSPASPEGQGYYEHGAVAYEGTKIVEIGEEAALRAKYQKAEIIDAKAA